MLLSAAGCTKLYITCLVFPNCLRASGVLASLCLNGFSAKMMFKAQLASDRKPVKNVCSLPSGGRSLLLWKWSLWAEPQWRVPFRPYKPRLLQCVLWFLLLCELLLTLIEPPCCRSLWDHFYLITGWSGIKARAWWTILHLISWGWKYSDLFFTLTTEFTELSLAGMPLSTSV